MNENEENIDDIILDKPTIRDLVSVLSKLPQDEKIFIEDADTGWRIEKIHIKKNGIKLFGKYEEMEK